MHCAQVVHAPAADRMEETECVLPAKLRSKARRALSAGGGGALSGASGDLAGGSSDDNEDPRPPPPAVALFEKVPTRICMLGTPSFVVSRRSQGAASGMVFIERNMSKR